MTAVTDLYTAFVEDLAAALAAKLPSSGGGSTPAPVPTEPFSTVLFSQDFSGPISWRACTLNPTNDYFDQHLRDSTGQVTPFIFWQLWGDGHCWRYGPNSETATVHAGRNEVKATNLPFLTTGADGLALRTLLTPPALTADGQQQKWSAPFLSWQHSFGVKPPYRIETEVQISNIAGLWPCVWMVGAERYAQAGHDGGPWIEIDVCEFFTKVPKNVIHALHWSDPTGAMQLSYDPASHSPRGTKDFSAGFHTFAADVGADGSVQFYIDGEKTWKGQFPADAKLDQFHYPIISTGTGGNNDAGVPAAGVTDTGAFKIKSLKILGNSKTPPVFKHGW